MQERRAIDGFGAAALIGFASVLAFNQVVIKVTGNGFNPLFQAGLRSCGALAFLLIWMRLRRISTAPPAGTLGWGMLSGLAFTLEFICMYTSLDLTTVSRASVLFYTMPIWLGLAGHILLPGERLNRPRALGLILALGGVAVAVADRNNGQASLAGDLLALAGAMLWAAIGLLVRVTPLSQVRPEAQLLYQVIVSAVLLLALAPLAGPVIREPNALHLAGLAFQSVGVVGLGYLGWFWMMSVYKANAVASFSFLSPVLAVLFGWALLGEPVSASIWIALALVAAGIFLVNQR